MTQSGSLAGLRVLEIGDKRSGSLLGLIAAGLGADVAGYREPLADPELEAVEAAFFDRGKRIIPNAEDAASLAANADVLVTDLAPARLRELNLPTSEEEVQRLRSGLVHVAITSFGLTGPHADWASDDIVDWAAGGIGTMTRALTGAPGASHEPVLPPGRQPEMLGGLAAAVGLFAGLRESRAQARAVLVDVARVEVQASMGHHVFPAWLWSGVLHGSTGSPLAELGYYLETADGFVYVRPVEERHWMSLAALLQIPEDVAGERVDGMLIHHRDPAAVRALIEPRIRQWRADDLVAQGQAAGVPIADPASLEQVLGSPQLAERGAWRAMDVGGRASRGPALPLIEPIVRAPAVAATAASVLAAWR